MGDLYKEESLTDQSCTVLFPSKGQQPPMICADHSLEQLGGALPYMDYTGYPIGYGFLTEQSETRYTFAPITVIDRNP